MTDKKTERAKIYNRLLFLKKMNMVSKHGAILLPAKHYLPAWANCMSCGLYDFNKHGCEITIDRTNSILISCPVPKNVKIRVHWFCLEHKFKK